MAAHDEGFMRLALAMARRGLGRTWPNPSVGAVLVRPGETEVIARGCTMPGGRPHAEAVALERSGAAARGATMYVTLEPCSHHGGTPPCADAIIAAGVSRVVCGVTDCDSRVAGQGLARLRGAGIEVVTGVLEAEARLVTRGHLLRAGEGRPEITLKVATGSDGLIAPGSGAPVWVTGEQARMQAHLMRARSDAILVGRGTIEADDPELTCRLPGMADRSPVRVVLDSALATAETARILDAAPEVPVWICCGEAMPSRRRSLLEAAGAELVPVAASEDGRLDVISVANALAARGITRLLVEGGPNVARSFLAAGLVDRVVIFRGSRPVGGGLMPFVISGLERIEERGEFHRVDSRSLGDDVRLVFEKAI